MLRSVAGLFMILLAAGPAAADMRASLNGSPASMVRQNRFAKELDYTFIRTPGQVHRFVDQGHLVDVSGNADYRVNRGVSFPYARPELRLFLERLGAQYRRGCGEQLVVTSLTRPTGRQPRNSHPLSVHPAGMAADLRISQSSACRAWLENALLSLEREGVLDVTRERRPPHYHVALFTDRYAAHVAELMAADSAREARLAAAATAKFAAAASRIVATPFLREAGLAAAASPQEAAATDLQRKLLGIGLAALFLVLVARGSRRVKAPQPAQGSRGNRRRL